MAERSFVQEVEKLRLGEGEEFRGEGILAVAKALLQSGVAYIGGYQGAPISHLIDVFTDAQPILDELDIHFDASASEAAAAATLAASVNYPLRGAVAWKSPVGTNVASDALSQLASSGVKGGALVVIGEDYGEGSSIMQERTHAFAMKSQMWLLDPRPNLPSIVRAVDKGFLLSEATSTPVMLELRIRACHVYGRFKTKANKRPPFTVRDAMEAPNRDAMRIVLPPFNFGHEHEKVRDRWPTAQKHIQDEKLNEFFGPTDADLGIIVQGGLYNTLIRSMERLGLATPFGESNFPIYVLNVTYPILDNEVKEFCANKKAVLLMEEGQPDFIEQNINTILRRADMQTKVSGKDMLPLAGEYAANIVIEGLERFFAEHGVSASLSAPAIADNTRADSAAVFSKKELETLQKETPARPAGFCTGCPERPVFTAIKLLQHELGDIHISCDIGCHLFSILPPFNIGNTTMGYGLGPAGAAAFNVETDKRTISVIGDGGFWHNGLTTSVGNAVFNKSDNVIIVIDNNYSAATGGQDLMSSRAQNKTRSTNHAIQKAVNGVGVDWVRTVRTYDLLKMRDALREAMTTKQAGPKVVVAESECMLNKQRREKPLFKKAVTSGRRVVRERFGVDPDTCTGDHSCIRLSGCPSLTVKPNPDPLREDPIAHVDNSCVGCGLCGEVAHAAVLCPSFYRADIIYNPSKWDRFIARCRQAVIGFLQRHAERRRLKCTI